METITQNGMFACYKQIWGVFIFYDCVLYSLPYSMHSKKNTLNNSLCRIYQYNGDDLDFNFDLYQDVKQHEFTNVNKEIQEKLSI